MNPVSNPVFVALDATDPDYARELAERVRGCVGGLKLGLEFFNAHGPQGVQPFVELGLPVFLDLKYHDIPNTVAGACRFIISISTAWRAKRKRSPSASTTTLPPAE